jgi:HSP20 family protein
MLTRWDPIREMLNFRNRVDRMFLDAYDGQSDGWDRYEWGLPLDVAENENNYIIKASFPGVKPDDIDIKYSGNTLTIVGEIRQDELEGTYHMRERRYGRFTRSITQPTQVNADNIHADYEAGIWTLHIPKAEEAKTRRIPIKTTKQLKG